METVRDIVTLALKKLGVLRGSGTANNADAESGRASLQSFLMSCITARTFGDVASVLVTDAGAITAALNQHINATVDGVAVDLPDTVPACFWYCFEPYGDYGWPWCNPSTYASDNMKVPDDLSVVRVTSTESDDRLTYLFDGTIQRWLRIDNLTLNSEAPLSARDSDGLASVLAVRLSDEFTDPRPATVLAAKRFKLALVEVRASTCGDYC